MVLEKRDGKRRAGTRDGGQKRKAEAYSGVDP